MVAIEFLENGSVPKARHATHNPQIQRQINASRPDSRERNGGFGFVAWLHLLVLILIVGFFSFPRITHANDKQGNTTFDGKAVLHVRGDFNYPPFEYLGEQNQAEGFNVDVMNAVAKAMGIKVEIDLGPWEEVMPQLKKGEIDALLGMFKTVERDKNFDFSVPHFIGSYTVFVRKDSAIQSIDDAKDKTIIVQQSDLGHDYVKENGLDSKIITKSDWSEVLNSLSRGEGDCAIVSRLQGLRFLDKQATTNVKAVGPPIIQEKYGFAVANGNSALLSVLNEGLSIIKTSGEYDAIYKKWFGVYDEQGSSFRNAIKYLIWIVIPLLVLTLAAFFWSWMLKREVTKREKLLLEREDSYRRLLDNLNAGVVVHAPDTSIRLSNPRSWVLLGLNSDQMTGKRALDPGWKFLTEAGVPMPFEEFPVNQVITSKKALSSLTMGVFRPLTNDVVWLMVNGFPVFDDSKELSEIIISFIDITQLKDTADKLQTKGDDLRESQRIAYLGTWRMDVATGQIIYSEELSKIFDYDPDLPPPTYEEHIKLFTPFSWEILSAAVAKAIDTGMPYELELEYVRKDGSVGWVWTRGEAKANSEGKTISLWGATQEITTRKRAEIELAQHRLHLEELVTQRTAELVQAKTAAEAANYAKSAFLANMSHEIRTPMNGIVGMANILRREGISPQQAKRLDTIDVSARHLLSVINDILDLSKIEAGKFTLEESPVVVSSLLANISSILAERAQAKGLRLLIEAGHIPHNLLGDPTRLQQALLNYATNAVKITETGTVTLRVVVEEDADELEKLRFEVTDSGIGITPEAMSRIFSTFEQADNSMTRKYGGTGLGLAITKRLAELMGGEVGADSTPGVGSTFWFTVKLKKGDATAVPLATVANAEAEIRRHYAGQCILVVDDEPINREVTTIQLEYVDLHIDTADDGAEAVAMAQDNDYAVILMDMQMPKLNGLDATRQIRKLVGYEEVPIIAMTANAFVDDKAECIAAGMNDVLIKPFNPEDLFATLLKWLDQQHG